jgi:hypothetical protein
VTAAIGIDALDRAAYERLGRRAKRRARTRRNKLARSEAQHSSTMCTAAEWKAATPLWKVAASPLLMNECRDRRAWRARVRIDARRPRIVAFTDLAGSGHGWTQDVPARRALALREVP